MDRQSWLQGTLYRPQFEQDSCGFGLITQMDDKPSHWLVSTAISSLASLTHRGAVAADGKSGDGCGLLFRKPDGFLRAVSPENGFALADRYAAGLVFHTADTSLANLHQAIEAHALVLAVILTGPTNIEACGEHALKTLPLFKQLFVNCPADREERAFERKLYQAQ